MLIIVSNIPMCCSTYTQRGCNVGLNAYQPGKVQCGLNTHPYGGTMWASTCIQRRMHIYVRLNAHPEGPGYYVGLYTQPEVGEIWAKRPPRGGYVPTI